MNETTKTIMLFLLAMFVAGFVIPPACTLNMVLTNHLSKELEAKLNGEKP